MNPDSINNTGLPTPCVTRPSCSPASWAGRSWRVNGACAASNGGKYQRRRHHYTRSTKQSFNRLWGRAKAAVESCQCMARATARSCRSGTLTGQDTGNVCCFLRWKHEEYGVGAFITCSNGITKNARLSEEGLYMLARHKLAYETQAGNSVSVCHAYSSIPSQAPISPLMVEGVLI